SALITNAPSNGDSCRRFTTLASGNLSQLVAGAPPCSSWAILQGYARRADDPALYDDAGGGGLRARHRVPHTTARAAASSSPARGARVRAVQQSPDRRVSPGPSRFRRAASSGSRLGGGDRRDA